MFQVVKRDGEVDEFKISQRLSIKPLMQKRKIIAKR